MSLDTYPTERIESMQSSLAALEAENKALRDRFSDADTERNVAQGALKAAFARVAELEARCKRMEEAVESLLPYAEATDDESSEWGPGRWKSEKLKRIIDEARKAKEPKP